MIDLWKTVVGLGLAMIILVTVALPIITDSFKNISTEEANTDERYLAISDGKSITFDSDSDGFTVNGERHSWVTGTTGSTPDRLSTPPVFGSDFMVVPPVSLGAGSYSNPVIVTEDGNQGNTSHIVIENGTMTYNDGTTDRTVQVTGPVYYVSDKGDYGLYKNTANIDYGATAYVVLCSWQSQATRTMGIYKLFDGQTSPVFDAIHWTADTSVVTASNVTVNATAEGHDTYYTYTLTNMTVDGTVHGPGHLTIVCPIAYHVVTDSDATLRTIASMIPILLVLSLVVGIAYQLTRRIQ